MATNLCYNSRCWTINTVPLTHSSSRFSSSLLNLKRSNAQKRNSVPVSVSAIVVTHWVYKWMNPKCNGKLPPGSMGFPIIGETLEFFSPHSSYGIPPFFQKRIARYGPVFRTSIVGQRVVVCTDPEINYSIFQQEGKSFLLWYTESFTKIFGEKRLNVYHGMIHKYLKNLILQLVSPEKLKANFLHDMNSATCMNLQTWASKCIIDVKEETSIMLFGYFAKKLISYEDPNEVKNLKDNFNAFLDGLVSFPLNIPGTTFHACLQGRKNVVNVIKNILKQRKESKIRFNDFLDHLVDEVKKEETILDESLATHLVFVLLFAAFETTSSAITLAINFISDHLDVMAELAKEHETIMRNRESQDYEITWQEYKSMTFTQMVINETIRLANIAPAIIRKVVKDVQMKGYTVPAGWAVMIVPSVVHLNPDTYEDPHKFNPWRWKGQDLHVGSKTFMAFGGGSRMCVGADFAKLQMAIFLHHLVTKYRWNVIKRGEIIRRPGLAFPNGFHVEIKEKISAK